MLEFRYIKKPYQQVFVLCFLLAFVLFLPITIYDLTQGNVFHYAGDYNSQQIHYWMYANAFIKSGGTFSWNTELGSGFFNSYAYSPIGSPYFWLSIIVPSNLMPWAMLPLLCLKFAVAGTGGYIWSRRWIVNPDYSMLVGILYAFCGYNIYSIFYNSFLDATSLFPFMLAALDEFVLEKKYGKFPIIVGINLLANYFMFAGEAVFLLMYFACMVLSRAYTISLRSFFRLFFETMLGIAIGCAILIPTVIYMSQVPRTGNHLNDYGFICYGTGQKYMAILSSMFLMPDAPFSSNIFSSAGVRWQNCCAYLPIVGITGGLALCRANRKHPFSKILRFSVICAFIPILNAAFTLENSQYYARWFFMPTLILCGATSIVFSDEPMALKEWPDAWKTTFGFTAFFALLGIVPSTVEIFGTRLGVTESASLFWLIWGISIAGVFICGWIFKKYYGTKKFVSILTTAVFLFSFGYAEVHMMVTRFSSDAMDAGYSWYDGYEDTKNVKALLPQNEFYRTDTGGEENYNYDWNTSSESFFNSTVAPGIFTFYDGMGLTRGVHSTYSQDIYALRSLLSTRFVMVRPQFEQSWCGTAEGDEITINNSTVEQIQELKETVTDSTTYIPAEWAKNWEEYARTKEFIIYENQNFIPMGFTYNYYITKKQYDEIAPEKCANILLKALVLSDEQVEKFKDILQPLPESELENCTYEAFENDCADRREQTADTFETNNYGFTATTSFDTDELVFFSVPYEKNAFTATVNGKPVDVEEVDCGLMAIPVPAGKADIVVTYHTPGLKLGIAISISGLIIWAVYAFACYSKKKKLSIAASEETSKGKDVSDSLNEE